MDPPTNATPTGSKDFGGRDFADKPAQKLCASPATVANPVIPCFLNEIVNFTALVIGSADVSATKAGIPSTGPGACNHPWRKVLRVGAHIQRRSCASPDLPGSFRIPQSFQKPRFLLGSEDGLRGIRPTEVRNLLVPETDGVGRFASVVIPDRHRVSQAPPQARTPNSPY